MLKTHEVYYCYGDLTKNQYKVAVKDSHEGILISEDLFKSKDKPSKGDIISYVNIKGVKHVFKVFKKTLSLSDQVGKDLKRIPSIVSIKKKKLEPSIYYNKETNQWFKVRWTVMINKSDTFYQEDLKLLKKIKKKASKHDLDVQIQYTNNIYFYD